MDKIYIKNNFSITVKNGKNDKYGNSKIEISVYAKYGQKEEYENINYMLHEKKIIKYNYNKNKNCFSTYFYNFSYETIENIFTLIKNVFND